MKIKKTKLCRQTFFSAMRPKNEKGFVVPLAMLLMVVLTISGTSLMQYHFLELRMAMNEVDNHGAFYLANASIERARDAFKIPDTLKWTSVLNDAAKNDPSPDIALCPDAANRGCVIPPFGATVNTGAGLPFEGTFDAGQYEARAFDNKSSGPYPDLNDDDGILAFRARGTIHGEKKIIEVSIKATSTLKLINCQGGTGAACPEQTNGNPGVTPMPGREPLATSTLPAFDYPLTDSRNYYRTTSNFGLPVTTLNCPSKGKAEVNLSSLADNTYYKVNCDLVVQGTGTNNHIVLFSTGNIAVKSGVTLSNGIIVGATGITLSGNVSISAPLPYPALVSTSVTSKANSSVQIYGTIYSSGAINLNPIDVHGTLIGADVQIQGGSGTLFTDDNNLAYYTLMPGFVYTNDQKTTVTIANSWKEIK